VHRPSFAKPLIYPDDPHVVAIATDEPFSAPLPLLPLSDAATIAAFITDYLGLGSWRS
jgi:molybdopterin-guanine dinucleotide biosynthesis protein B